MKLKGILQTKEEQTVPLTEYLRLSSSFVDMEKAAAAAKQKLLEREIRALRSKMSLMRGDHEDMVAPVDYETDDYDSVDPDEPVDEMVDDGSESEASETDSELSDSAPDWDLYLERKPRDETQ